ncbi:MAG TPA: PilZ domain-containing protein, partial [Myxococcaceae bacterium]|nr:PilZ domain-containing protein [Myxococcaceae bacterium]
MQDDREVEWTGQREYARVEIELPCLIDGFTPGQIHNISVGGALVTGPRGLADVDDTVSLEFKVGRESAVAMFGEVLRVSAGDGQAAYGIEF